MTGGPDRGVSGSTPCPTSSGTVTVGPVVVPGLHGSRYSGSTPTPTAPRAVSRSVPSPRGRSTRVAASSRAGPPSSDHGGRRRGLLSPPPPSSLDFVAGRGRRGGRWRAQEWFPSISTSDGSDNNRTGPSPDVSNTAAGYDSAVPPAPPPAAPGRHPHRPRGFRANLNGKTRLRVRGRPLGETSGRHP